MDTAINIGGTIPAESVKAVEDAVARILEVAFATRMDQETVRAALEQLQVFSVKNASISNCTIVGEQK